MTKVSSYVQVANEYIGSITIAAKFLVTSIKVRDFPSNHSFDKEYCQ